MRFGHVTALMSTMADTVRNNSFAKIALLLVGVFVSAVVVIIAVNVSKQPPTTIHIVNSTNINTASTNAVAPVDPVYSSRIYAATGTVTEKLGNVLTVRANMYIENVLTERTYTVQVTPNTIYTIISNDTGLSSDGTFGDIGLGDKITFSSDDNLVVTTSIIATMIDKIVD